jgi:hypothetical protein
MTDLEERHELLKCPGCCFGPYNFTVMDTSDKWKSWNRVCKPCDTEIGPVDRVRGSIPKLPIPFKDLELE